VKNYKELKKLKELSETDLEKELIACQETLLKLRFQKVVDEVKDTSQTKKTKKRIARILTLLTMKK
jgi:large subunit ribosomal protein L29